MVRPLCLQQTTNSQNVFRSLYWGQKSQLVNGLLATNSLVVHPENVLQMAHRHPVPKLPFKMVTATRLQVVKRQPIGKYFKSILQKNEINDICILYTSGLPLVFTDRLPSVFPDFGRLPPVFTDIGYLLYLQLLYRYSLSPLKKAA